MEAGENNKENTSTHSSSDDRPPLATKILLNGKSLTQEEKPGLLKKIKALRGAKTSSTSTIAERPSLVGRGGSIGVGGVGGVGGGGGMLAPPLPPLVLQRADKAIGSKSNKDMDGNQRKSSDKLTFGEVPKKSTVLGLPLLCCTYFAAIYSLLAYGATSLLSIIELMMNNSPTLMPLYLLLVGYLLITLLSFLLIVAIQRESLNIILFWIISLSVFILPEIGLNIVLAENSMDWFNTPNGFYTLVFLVIRVTVDLFCIGIILYYHMNRTRRQRYLRAMLKPIKKKIVSGQALRDYNEVNGGSGGGGQGSASGIAEIDSDKLMHIQYPVIDSMPMPKLPDVYGGGGSCRQAGGDLMSPPKRLMNSRLSIGFNLLEPNSTCHRETGGGGGTDDVKKEEKGNEGEQPSLKAPPPPQSSDASDKQQAALSTNEQQQQQRFSDYRPLMAVPAPPLQQKSVMPVPILNPLGLNTVCINETTKPTIPSRNKVDISMTTPVNINSASSNYYKYAQDSTANAYAKNQPCSTTAAQQSTNSVAQPPPPPPTNANVDGNNNLPPPPPSINTSYLVSTEHPNPAVTLSSEQLKRKHLDMAWNHPYQQQHHHHHHQHSMLDDNTPLRTLSSTRLDSAVTNNASVSMMHGYGGYYHPFHQHAQQQQQRAADYAHMILVDDRQEQLMRFKNNLIRAKSTDVGLNRPTSALIVADDYAFSSGVAYRPYYVNAAAHNYSNNYNSSNYMYQPGIILPSGQHPYYDGRPSRSGRNYDMVPIEFKRAKRHPHQSTSIYASPPPPPQPLSNELPYQQQPQQQQQQPPRYANYMSSKQAKIINLSNHHIYLPPSASNVATTAHHPQPQQQQQQVSGFSQDPAIGELYQNSGRSNYDYATNVNANPLDMDYNCFNYVGGKKSGGGEAEEVESGAGGGGDSSDTAYNNSNATVWRGSACDCINIATCSRENLNEFLHSKDCVFFAQQQQQQQQHRRAVHPPHLPPPPYRHNYYMMMNSEPPNYVKLRSFSRSDYNITRGGNVKLV